MSGDDLPADAIVWSPLSAPAPQAIVALRDPARAAPVTDDIVRAAGLYDLASTSPPDDVADRLRRLAELTRGDAIARAAIRARAIDVLTRSGVRGPARLVDAALGQVPAAPTSDAPVIVRDDEPWAEPVDGAALAETITDLVEHYVVLPAHAAPAVTLWVLHTYLMGVWYISPLLVLTSPAPRCGKTTLLMLAAQLAHRALAASSISAAAVYRVIETQTPTLLLDEADTYLRRGGHDDDALRGVLDGGHTRPTARVIRCVGDDHVPTACSTWSAKLLALIGRPPATITDRSITIGLRRRLPSEPVARLRADRLEQVCAPLRRQLRRWTDDHADVLRDAEPDVPAELHDRAADNWRPLLAIADALGDAWPARARTAAVVLTGAEPTEAIGVELLADLRAISADLGDPDLLPSTPIVERLTALEDRPWGEWRPGGRGEARPLTGRGLARLLAPYGISTTQRRVSGRPLWSYRRDLLAEAWERYLPVQGEIPAVHPVQRDAANDDGPASRIDIRDSGPGRHGCATVTEADSTGLRHAVTDVHPGSDVDSTLPLEEAPDDGDYRV